LIWKTNLEVEFLRYVTHNIDDDIYYNLFAQFMMYDNYKYQGKYMNILKERKATGKPFKKPKSNKQK